jgi:uncharacterized membrane protein YfcA
MIEAAKRFIDWLIMASAGGLLVGLFQDRGLALAFSLVSLFWALAMAWAISRKERKK